MRYITSFFVSVLIGLMAQVTQAQVKVVPDGTLGSKIDADASKADRYLINGGATKGSNLFHSFKEFSFGSNEQVYFASPNSISNIFSRVTGMDPSKIDGVLGVNGSANLFFLNPNGIMFGKNARLDMSGTFIGSTASGVRFEDSTLFDTAAAQSPMLTMSVPIGLQFGSVAKEIGLER